MRFKDEFIRPGMVIRCPTEENAKTLLAHLEQKGYRWSNGERLDSGYMLEKLHESYADGGCPGIKTGYSYDKLQNTVGLTREIPTSGTTSFSDISKEGDAESVRKITGL